MLMCFMMFVVYKKLIFKVMYSRQKGNDGQAKQPIASECTLYVIIVTVLAMKKAATSMQ